MKLIANVQDDGNNDGIYSYAYLFPVWEACDHGHCSFLVLSSLDRFKIVSFDTVWADLECGVPSPNQVHPCPHLRNCFCFLPLSSPSHPVTVVSVACNGRDDFCVFRFTGLFEHRLTCVQSSDPFLLLSNYNGLKGPRLNADSSLFFMIPILLFSW